MQTNSQHISFIDLFTLIKKKCEYLRSNILIIAMVVIGFGSIGFFYKKWIGPTYKASLTFVSENAGGDKIGAYAGIAAQFGIDLGQSGGGIFEGDNLLELFKSRKLVIKTLLSPSDIGSNNNLLIDDYLWNNGLDKKLKNYSSTKNYFQDYNTQEVNREKDSILNSVYKLIYQSQLKVEKKDKKTGIINLEFIDQNENFAKRFIEQLSNNVIKFYSDYKTKKSNESLMFLQNQADSLKNLLNSSISSEAATSDLNINPNKQILRVGSIKKRIDVSANTQLYSEVLKQSAIAKITLLRETPLIQIIDVPMFPLDKVGFGKGLTAILFAMVGFIFIVIYLLFKHALKEAEEIKKQ